MPRSRAWSAAGAVVLMTSGLLWLYGSVSNVVGTGAQIDSSLTAPGLGHFLGATGSPWLWYGAEALPILLGAAALIRRRGSLVLAALAGLLAVTFIVAALAVLDDAHRYASAQNGSLAPTAASPLRYVTGTGVAWSVAAAGVAVVGAMCMIVGSERLARPA